MAVAVFKGRNIETFIIIALLFKSLMKFENNGSIKKGRKLLLMYKAS